MNTFLPFDSFEKSAACLDKRRCFKQLVEAHQILNVLDMKSSGWANHPAVKMWVGCREYLQWYYNVFYKYCVHTHKINIKKLPEPALLLMYIDPWRPKWLGYPAFHESMRRNLYRKAIDDSAKGRYELLINMEKLQIVPDDIEDGYLWPIDKQGNLLLEIQKWYNGQRQTNS